MGRDGGREGGCPASPLDALDASRPHLAQYCPSLSLRTKTDRLPGGRFGGFESRLRQDFSWLSHTCDLQIGTPVATLPGAWRYRVSAGTGWPSVSIL